MSEFLMSEGLKRIILRSQQTDDELWDTVARLYRTYGWDGQTDPCPDCNGAGVQWFRSGSQPCATCGGSGESNG